MKVIESIAVRFIIFLTVGALLIAVYLFSVEVVHGAQYIEDFDSLATPSWSETFFDLFSGVPSDPSTNATCISSPNCWRGGIGAIEYAGFALPVVSSNGVISAFVKHSNTNAVSAGVGIAEDLITTHRFSVTAGSDDVLYLSISGIAQTPLGTMTIGEWYSVSLQWRSTSQTDLIEVKASVAGDSIATTTDWIATLETPASFGTMIPYISGQSSFDNSAWVDNFFLDTSYVENDTDVVIDNNNYSGVLFNTRFLDVDISGASTTVQADIDYYLDTTEFTANNRPDAILVNVIQNDFFEGSGSLLTQYKMILPLELGDATTTILFDYDFPDGTYTAYFNFWNINNNSFTFDETSINAQFVVYDGAVTAHTVLDVYDNITGTNTPTAQTCGLTKLNVCIINAFQYLFVPNSVNLQAMYIFQDTLSQKFPFSLAFEIQDAIQSIEPDGTGAFPTYTMDIPIMGGEFVILSQDSIDLFIDDSTRLLIRSLILYVSWLGFAVMVFFTLANIFRSVTSPDEPLQVREHHHFLRGNK